MTQLVIGQLLGGQHNDRRACLPKRQSGPVLGTSTSKQLLVVSTKSQGVPKETERRGPKHSSNRRHRTSGRSCSRRSCPGRQRPNCRVRLRHAKIVPRHLNRPARCCRRFPRRLPRSQWRRPCLGPELMTMSLLFPPREKDDSKNGDSSTFRELSSQKDTRHVLRPLMALSKLPLITGATEISNRSVGTRPHVCFHSYSSEM